ncbi:MAG: hypothetical protein K0S00_3984 [Xanthobacteraceae bacterium]|nr:hypothetical protein [Xanthobacteraceae bacterium]
MTFDRAASAAIVQQRAVRRWFAAAHETCGCMLATRDEPAGTWNPANLPPPEKARPSKAPRHRALSLLAGLRAWVDKQSSAGDWLRPDNDNTPQQLRGPPEQRQTEAELDLLPSVDAMLIAIKGANPVRDGHRVTLGGLRFDHGRLTGWRSGAGEWLRPQERYKARRGTTAGATGYDRSVRQWMAVAGEWPAQPHQRRPVQPPRSDWPLRSARRDWLDVASPSPMRVGEWAGPAPRPASARDWLMVAQEPVPITRCPSPALPTLGRLSEQFLTGRCRPSGNACPGLPGPAPQELALIRAAEEAAAARLSRRHRRVLAKATTARTMADIGALDGLSGKTAERAAPQMLVEAAKNFEEILLAA